MKTITTASSIFLLVLLVAGCDSKDKDAAIQSPPAYIGPSYPGEIPKGRLPESVQPLHYTLDLTIVPSEPHFNGAVEIGLSIQTALTHLWLHGNRIEAQHAELELADGETVKAHYLQVDDTGIAKLNFDKEIQPGSAILRIRYRAPFDESLEGLYRVKDGDEYYAYTQFEPTAARLAFPGFDEPAFKVPFDISLNVKNEHNAITNTPEIETIPLEKGFKRIRYATTLPLPTYLIAFAVGPLDIVKWEDLPPNNTRKTPIPLRGITTKGKGTKLKYALQHSNEIVSALEDYFQIPYPYAKLDIIAVPDFQAGAMENAGAITYREQLILLDDQPSVQQQRRYMGIHAHELAHQWFGNLVTPVWWDDIWLNEAFATWMSYIVLDGIKPEHQFRHTLINNAFRAMGQDSLISARQIRQPITSNHDIDSAFDGITYNKGGGVLSMFESYLSAEKFRGGIQHYMHKFAFKNATADDFITAIAEKADSNAVNTIRQAFNSFIEQPGIPYLNVEHSCDTGHVQINISQSRYLPLGSKGSAEQSWKIPACFRYQTNGENKQYCKLLQQQTERFTLPEKTCLDYLLPNSQSAGYYRWSVSSENWKVLFAHKDALTTEDMMSVVDSFKAAVGAGKMDFLALMDIAPAIISSNASKVSLAPTSTFAFIREEVAQTEDEKNKLSAAYRKLYAQKMREIGFTPRSNDNIDTIEFRRELIEFLAEQGQDQALRHQLANMARAYTGYQNDNAIHKDRADPELINIALKVAVEDENIEYTRHLMKLFETITDSTIREKLLNAIAVTKNSTIAAELREWMLSEKLRDNEIFVISNRQLDKKTFRAEMWEWYKQNFEKIKARTPSSSHGDLTDPGHAFCSPDDLKEIENFFTPIINTLSGGPRALAQTLEGIELCYIKINFHKPTLKKYLEQPQS